MTNKAFGPVTLLAAVGLAGCVTANSSTSPYTNGYVPPQAFGPQDGPTVQYAPPPGYDYDYVAGSLTSIYLPGGIIWDLRNGRPHDRHNQPLPFSSFAHPHQGDLSPNIILPNAGDRLLHVSPQDPSRGSPYVGRPGVVIPPMPSPRAASPARPAIPATAPATGHCTPAPGRRC